MTSALDVTDVELLADLDAQLQDALPCDWVLLARARRGPNCTTPALYVLTWLEVCGCGNDVKYRYPSLLCRPHMLDVHAGWDTTNGSPLHCGACGCSIHGDPYHVIDKITQLGAGA